MQQEYANFLKQNPEIAVDIDQYFENKKRLSQTEQNLEENLENLKTENGENPQENDESEVKIDQINTPDLNPKKKRRTEK